jgi:hypothetical protein
MNAKIVCKRGECELGEVIDQYKDGKYLKMYVKMENVAALNEIKRRWRKKFRNKFDHIKVGAELWVNEVPYGQGGDAVFHNCSLMEMEK